jgi:hypothetical protein
LYKIRFPDGTELGIGNEDMPGRFNTKIVPPNTGVVVYFQDRSDFQAYSALYITGMYSKYDKTTTLVYLSLDDQIAGMLHWYTADNIYSVVSNQIGGRAGLFATDSTGGAVGLAARRNPGPQDDGWGIGRGIQEVPLVCSFEYVGSSLGRH